MKKVFITYGDEKFRQARDFSVFMARRFGKFDEAIAYSPKDVDDLFKAKMQRFFIQPWCRIMAMEAVHNKQGIK